MHPLQIVIVDDHLLFAEGLRHLLLNNVDFIETIDLVEDFESLRQVCRKKKIRLIIMDINLKKESGSWVTYQIKQHYPHIPVLALSAENEKNLILEMLTAGASGYLMKDAKKEELQTAIQAITLGGNYYSSTVSQILMNKKEHFDLPNPIEKLTDREMEILRFVIEDELSNKEIANRLFISPRTVETHKRNLIQKLRVKNTIGLAKRFFEYSTFNKNYGIPVG